MYKKKKWRGRWWKILYSCAVIMMLSVYSLQVSAAGVKVLRTAVYEGSIYIYVRGVETAQADTEIRIGNMICLPGQISAAAFPELEISMRTLVLLDNSKSIPEKNHVDVQEILKGIAETMTDREQMKIGVFSDKVSYLCDYTNDPDILNNVIDGISYYNQDSYLSDVLYDVISQLEAENTQVCTRVLIISDGADDKNIGYTNEEMRSFIEKNSYPVYTVGIPAKNNSTELETLFSFSRSAQSEYFLLDGSISNGDIVGALQQDQKGVCLRIEPDESLKDGSSKNILIKLGTEEGAAELRTTALMPFGTGSVSQPETEKNEETEVPERTEEPQATREPVQETETALPALKAGSGEASESKGILWIFFILGGVAIFAAALAGFIVLSRKKKRQSVQVKPPEKGNPPDDGGTEEPGVTVMSGGEAPEGGAKALWKKPEVQKYLVLKNLEHPKVMFKVPINDVIRIGRAAAEDIVIDDPELSRKHCEILLRGGLLYIKDCNSSNKTYYENVIVYDETPIVSGGKIKIGKYQYSVELVEE